jgi:DNA-binding transcriptional ArsR family regulator
LREICFEDLVNHMVNNRSAALNLTFAALADPTRRRILERLAQGQSPVTRLAAPFSISLPAVSKHLRVLENAGLLKRHRQGRQHTMQLDTKPMKKALRWMEQYRKFWEGALDDLANYLETTNQTKPKKGKS